MSGRISRVREAMERAGLDVLVARNPENVLYLSGYWPVNGWSLAVIPRDGEPLLIVPESELMYAEDSWIRDVRPIPVEKLDEVWNPYRHFESVLREFEVPERSRVGVELSFETSSITSLGVELSYTSIPTIELIERVWNAKLVDAAPLLYELRRVKDEWEISRIRLACELVSLGLDAAREKLREGVREVEMAAAFEREVHVRGTGYRGARRVRGYAFVMSGENASRAWYPYNVSSERRVRRGDLVLLELNVCVDGYWADVTRTWSLGTPSREFEDMHSTLIAAQDEVYENFRSGMLACDVDALARETVERRGYGMLFPHRLGHGIGVRLHEPPALHPASREVLVRGMVHTVEPGLYGRDFGMRVEDVVLDLDAGVEVLSKYPREL